MLRLLYNFILFLLYIPYIILILLRIYLKKEHKIKFTEKIFFTKVNRPSGFVFWFHVASIGELNSIVSLVNYYLKKDNKYNFLITTVTLSSFNQFSKEFGNNPRVFHQFLPYDLNFFSNNFLKAWKPDLVSFVDSEIWPNFIFAIKKENIPLVLLNARITKKTFGRWSLLKRFTEKIFGLFSLCISSSEETTYYLNLLKAKKIKYFGNLKFCAKIQKVQSSTFNPLNKLNDKKIWCAVSTHNNEEIFCSKVQKIINKAVKNSLCIIIPRHVDRTEKIHFNLKKLGFKSQVINENEAINDGTEIVIVNYYGAVKTFLPKIQNVFIGKSLIRKLRRVGGQSPIEAAKMGCFIFHGPYVSNFIEIYNFFKKKGFSEEINNPEELAKKLIFNFNSKDKFLNKSKIDELEVYSNSIFQKVINEYDTLINENFKT